MLQLAANNYDTIYKQSVDAYHTETGGTNTPPYTEWLGTLGGRTWQVQLDSAYKNGAGAAGRLQSAALRGDDARP